MPTVETSTGTISSGFFPFSNVVAVVRVPDEPNSPPPKMDGAGAGADPNIDPPILAFLAAFLGAALLAFVAALLMGAGFGTAFLARFLGFFLASSVVGTTTALVIGLGLRLLTKSYPSAIVLIMVEVLLSLEDLGADFLLFFWIALAMTL